MRNRTKVRYVKTRYFYQDDKTLCFLTYEIDINDWPFNNIKINADRILNIANELDMSYYDVDNKTNFPTTIAFTTVGTASCDTTTDTYDQGVGERIALTRAQAKAFERTCLFYDKLSQELHTTLNDMRRLINNCWDAGNKCWNHCKKLGNY